MTTTPTGGGHVGIIPVSGGVPTILGVTHGGVKKFEIQFLQKVWERAILSAIVLETQDPNGDAKPRVWNKERNLASLASFC